MRVLIAAKHPPGGALPVGGVQTWSTTVATELRERGHEVVLWGPGWALPPGEFDVGILANFKHTAPAARWCRRVLPVCHGIVPDERPPERDGVAFTAEALRDHWRRAGPVLRQPIDLAFWSPPWNPGTTLLQYGYRAPAMPVAAQAAQMLGLSFEHLKWATPDEARDRMRSAACVLASGRAALEAIACGAPVVVCDHRQPYQGPLMDDDLPRQMRNNYSGRGGVIPQAPALAAAINRATPMRDHVERHHDARTVVSEILCLLS